VRREALDPEKHQVFEHDVKVDVESRAREGVKE
jgi:hypothetical protein